MSTKTVSLSEDAYERLKSIKKRNESFSDVVRRITGKVRLRDFHGVLSEKAADELEEAVKERRKEHGENYEKRVKRTTKELEK